ncbi:MAG: hypothetical protein R2800_12540 [Flavipsychrobacter sp.]
MKKLILGLLAVAVVNTADAQKGSILAYGTAGIHTTKNDNGGGNETKQFNWNINPGVGYQFTDNITVGIQGGFMNMKNTANTSATVLNVTTTTETITRSNEWQAGVFFRYGMKISKLFTLYDQIDASYLAGKNTTDAKTTVTPGTTTTAPRVINGEFTGFQARLFPALQMHVKDGMALNFSFGGLQYRTVSTDVPGVAGAPTTTSKTSSFDLTFWQQMNFGISYNFGGGSGCCKKGAGNPSDDLRPMKIDSNQDDDDE